MSGGRIVEDGTTEEVAAQGQTYKILVAAE
jgi:ABC-type bacteriocin/lantibiotic exporter with double-glycine peptidase domain